MKSIKLFTISLSLFFLYFFLSPSTEVRANGTTFTVEPLFSGHQLDQSKTFYYLKTEPGKEQIIEVKLSNSTDKPLTIKAEVLNATTQVNGVIGYQPKTFKFDSTLKEPISDLIEIKDSIKLKPKESRVEKFTLKSPKDSYSGIKAGGLSFSEVTDKKVVNSVDMKYAYRIGIITSENGDTYSDGSKLNLIDAKASAVDGKKVVLGTLQNPEAKIINDLHIKASITDKSNNRVIKQKEVENYTLAPNSNFDLTFDWGIKKLPVGDFTMNITAKNGEHTWNLKKDFSISSETAEKINKSSDYQLKTVTWVKALTLVLCVLTIILIFLQLKRKKQMIIQIKDKRKNKKKKK